MSAAGGLDGLLEPLSRCLDAESARRVVDLQVDLPVQERIDTLAERANVQAGLLPWMLPSAVLRGRIQLDGVSGVTETRSVWRVSGADAR